MHLQVGRVGLTSLIAKNLFGKQNFQKMLFLKYVITELADILCSYSPVWEHLNLDPCHNEFQQILESDTNAVLFMCLYK